MIFIDVYSGPVMNKRQKSPWIVKKIDGPGMKVRQEFKQLYFDILAIAQMYVDGSAGRFFGPVFLLDIYNALIVQYLELPVQ